MDFTNLESAFELLMSVHTAIAGDSKPLNS